MSRLAFASTRRSARRAPVLRDTRTGRPARSGTPAPAALPAPAQVPGANLRSRREGRARSSRTVGEAALLVLRLEPPRRVYAAVAHGLNSPAARSHISGQSYNVRN